MIGLKQLSILLFICCLFSSCKTQQTKSSLGKSSDKELKPIKTVPAKIDSARMLAYLKSKQQPNKQLQQLEDYEKRKSEVTKARFSYSASLFKPGSVIEDLKVNFKWSGLFSVMTYRDYHESVIDTAGINLVNRKFEKDSLKIKSGVHSNIIIPLTDLVNDGIEKKEHNGNTRIKLCVNDNGEETCKLFGPPFDEQMEEFAIYLLAQPELKISKNDREQYINTFLKK